MSFTFCTTDSHSLFSAVTSIWAVAPVVVAAPPAAAPGAPDWAVPNWVEAVDCIFTLRVALR
jgi:hypothetical protein